MNPISNNSPRRDFLKLSGAAALGLVFARLPAHGRPFTREDFDKIGPAGDPWLAAKVYEKMFLNKRG